LRKGSKRWAVLYQQVVDAVRSLYLKARLVHGDLSEYNILVAPAFLVENKAESIENEMEEVQAVLIDFGQAVDVRHPESANLLHRDLDRIESFFQRQGVETLGLEKLTLLVTSSF
jgi:RIO kinase 1